MEIRSSPILASGINSIPAALALLFTTATPTLSASSPKTPRPRVRVCSITTATFFFFPRNCRCCERSGAATFYFRPSGRELSNMVLLGCTPTSEAGYLFTNDYRHIRGADDLTVRNLTRVAVWCCFAIYLGLFMFNIATRIGRFSPDSMHYVNVVRNIAEVVASPSQRLASINRG